MIQPKDLLVHLEKGDRSSEHLNLKEEGISFSWGVGSAAQQLATAVAQAQWHQFATH